MTDLATIAERGFVFAYPLVLMERMRARATAVAAPRPATMQAPMNKMVHARTIRECVARFPEPPNVDVLLSAAWLDLRAGPVALSVPDTHGRYYVLTLLDMWTDVFASIGARTTGTGRGTYAITGPRWNAGAIPVGMKPIAASTDVVHVTGHTQTDGDDDHAVHATQDGYRLHPLPGPWRTSMPHLEGPPPIAGRTPAEEVDAMDAQAFFAEAARLMRVNPPHPQDRPIVELVRDAGLLGDWEALSDAARGGVERGARHGAALIRAESEAAGGEVIGNWRVSYEIGRFGTDYLRRAGVARAGLATHPAADELPALVSSDADGQPLSGRNRYVLRFAPDAPPPVNGFWSLTAYAAGGPSVDAFRSIGDRDGLAIDPDGSLPIHLQYDRPARRCESNWLPVPRDGFEVVLRMYWPRDEVRARYWVPPAVTRVDAEPATAPGNPRDH